MPKITRRNLSKDKGIHTELRRAIDEVYDMIDQHSRLLERQERNVRQVNIATQESFSNISGLLGIYGQSILGEDVPDPQVASIPTTQGIVTSVAVDSNNAAIASTSGSPITGAGTITINFSSTPVFTNVSLNGGLKLLGFTSSAGAPTTTELPADKDASIHKDTGTSKIYLAFNDGGVIKKVELT